MYVYVYVCLYCAVEAQSIKVCALMTIHVCMYIVYSIQRQNSDISLPIMTTIYMCVKLHRYVHMYAHSYQ